MNKEAKATEYRIEPIVTMLRSDMISTGGTETKAKELEGKWVELNKIMSVLVESNKATLVYSDTGVVGCACGRCNNNVMCEHIIAFEALKSPPQLKISSPDYRWLQMYLFSKGWTSDEDRQVYPTMDDSMATPEVVAELPPIGESTKLDPVNEDPDLDIGVEEEPEQKTYSRDCKYCGEIISGTDLAQVKMDIAEHTSGCPKNPANKKRSQANDVTVDETEVPIVPKETSTIVKNATVEKPEQEDKKEAPVVAHGARPKTEPHAQQQDKKVAPEKPTEDKKVKQSTAVTKTEPKTPAVEKEMPTEAEFQLAKVERLMKSQGSIYKVSGKEVADSAAVSSYAVSSGVSTETTVLEQTAEYARATVRAYKGGRYTEGSVLIRRDAILEKLMIDLAEKNPDWIIGWSNGLPEFDLNQTVFIGDKRKILGLHIAGVVADKWMFASRDCETKAGRRAQIKMLGADWREDDEVESEVEEMKTVAKR